MVTTPILAKVEAGPLQKAVEGLVGNAYAVTLASQTETEIRGFVVNGDGQEFCDDCICARLAGSG